MMKKKTTLSEPTGRPLIEIVTDGGMRWVKEVPGQKGELKDKYFDVFATYAPFEWFGSRRLTKEELEEYANS